MFENAGYRFTIHNDKYTAVLTGRTVKILNKGTKEELARFRDLKNAMFASFNPVKNMLVTKSQFPWLAFYCLDTMTLLRAIEVQKPTYYKKELNKYDYPVMQECGFCFSHDGKRLLNIENVSRPPSSERPEQTVSHLVEYDCDTFEEKARHFAEDDYNFRIIERHKDGYLLAGAQLAYPKARGYNTPFIASFDGKELTKKREITHEEYFKDISPYSAMFYQ